MDDEGVIANNPLCPRASHVQLVYVNQAVDMDVGHLGLIGGTAAC